MEIGAKGGAPIGIRTQIFSLPALLRKAMQAGSGGYCILSNASRLLR